MSVTALELIRRERIGVEIDRVQRIAASERDALGERRLNAAGRGIRAGSNAIKRNPGQLKDIRRRSGSKGLLTEECESATGPSFDRGVQRLLKAIQLGQRHIADERARITT